jgi:hypothetical protein
MLTGDSNTVMHFDADTCFVTGKSTGALIACVSHISKKLYTLNIQSTTADHALTVPKSPILETWLRCLGPTNHQSLWDMAKKGTLTGALLTSPLKLPMCKSCVLSKQTKTPVPKKHQEGPGNGP